ncbi:hypothetical protein AB2523_30615, partial [Klebsiella michiganensis]|uniref:hypothetical protein n=1 Tax=Klebsiella michiganensis TaxID=1134687 RepID=UPI003463A934
MMPAMSAAGTERTGAKIDVRCERKAEIAAKKLTTDTVSIHISQDETVPLKWFTEFGHLNRGDMLTSEQHRCHN